MPITIEDIKNMSPQMKALLIGLVMLLLCYAFWFLYLDEAMAKRSDLSKKLTDLQQQVREKEPIAKQKDKYIKELKELRELLDLALTKLPNQREIPGLFLAVAESGKEAGVDFLLFEPKAPEKTVEQKPADTKANLKPSDQRATEQSKDKKTQTDTKKDSKAAAKKSPEPQKFYEEIPVRVSVSGGFHSTAIFFDKVAKLPRIININDISISNGKNVKGQGRVVTTSCVIKTYMFLEKKNEKAK